MRSFSSAQPYTFTIDDSAYSLKPLLFEDVEEFDSIQNVPAEDRTRALRDFIFKRADARTQKAIKSLAITDVMELVKDWAGVDLGESSSSPVD